LDEGHLQTILFVIETRGKCTYDFDCKRRCPINQQCSTNMIHYFDIADKRTLKAAKGWIRENVLKY
jgi:hypothetical protein